MGAINYTIDSGKNLVFTDCQGSITVDELKKMVDTLMADPAYCKGLHSITDITGTSLDSDFSALTDLHSTIRTMEDTRGRYKWALVIDDRNDLENINLFKMLSMDGTAEIELFTSRKEAEAWVGV